MNLFIYNNDVCINNRAFWVEAKGLVADGVRYSSARLGQGGVAPEPGRGGGAVLGRSEYGAVDGSDGAGGGGAPARGSKSGRRSSGDNDRANGGSSRAVSLPPGIYQAPACIHQGTI